MSRDIAGQKIVAQYIQNAEKRKCFNQECSTLVLSFRIEGDNSLDKQKLKEFIATKLALQEMLKGLLSP